jgi:hypothetical protein
MPVRTVCTGIQVHDVSTASLRSVLRKSFKTPAKAVYQCKLDHPRCRFVDARPSASWMQCLTYSSVDDRPPTTWFWLEDACLFGNQAGASFMYEKACEWGQRDGLAMIPTKKKLEIRVSREGIFLSKTFQGVNLQSHHIPVFIKAETLVGNSATRIALKFFVPIGGKAVVYNGSAAGCCALGVRSQGTCQPSKEVIAHEFAPSDEVAARSACWN